MARIKLYNFNSDQNHGHWIDLTEKSTRTKINYISICNTFASANSAFPITFSLAFASVKWDGSVGDLTSGKDAIFIYKETMVKVGHTLVLDSKVINDIVAREQIPELIKMTSATGRKTEQINKVINKNNSFSLLFRLDSSDDVADVIVSYDLVV